MDLRHLGSWPKVTAVMQKAELVISVLWIPSLAGFDFSYSEKS